MNMIHFHEMQVPAEEVTKPFGNKVSHHWGRDWTRIEFSIPETFSVPKVIEEWIENNLDGGRYGYFCTIDRSPNTNGRSRGPLAYKMVIGFEFENDALMFKLLDGHLSFENREDIF